MHQSQLLCKIIVDNKYLKKNKCLITSLLISTIFETPWKIANARLWISVCNVILAIIWLTYCIELVL